MLSRTIALALLLGLLVACGPQQDTPPETPAPLRTGTVGRAPPTQAATPAPPRGATGPAAPGSPGATGTPALVATVPITPTSGAAGSPPPSLAAASATPGPVSSPTVEAEGTPPTPGPAGSPTAEVTGTPPTAGPAGALPTAETPGETPTETPTLAPDSPQALATELALSFTPVPVTPTFTPAPPTETPTPSPPDLVLQSRAAMDTLHLVHYQLDVFPTADQQTLRLEGEYQAPNSSILTATVDSFPSEAQLILDGNLYLMLNGLWVAQGFTQVAPIPGLTGTWVDTTIHNNLDVVRSFPAVVAAACRHFTDTGQEQSIEGVRTRQFTCEIAPYRQAPNGVLSQVPAELPPVGTAVLYIDPITGYLHQLVVDEERRRVYVESGESLPDENPPHIRVAITYSRHNDSALVVPTVTAP